LEIRFESMKQLWKANRPPSKQRRPPRPSTFRRICSQKSVVGCNGRNQIPASGCFPRRKGHPWGLQNYLNRVLKPAAVRARVGVFTRTTRSGDHVESTDVNFQVLRRTGGTLFGAKAKDPRDTQAQLRHADPSVTLRHYQKSIPASIRTAAVALEKDLIKRKGRK
jgi:integrase